MSVAESLIRARGLEVAFTIGGGLFGGGRRLAAVAGVSLDIRHGEVLAIVGESGCGKTTLARTLMGLQTPTAGEVELEGRPLAALSRRQIARRVQPIFQDPYASLNPRKTISSIIALPLIVQGDVPGTEQRHRVAEMMNMVGLPVRLMHAYPSQLSGGQRQRVAIARALVTHPRLVVCDEPTSALDVSVQAQILNLLQDLRQAFDLTYVFISHNLAVVQHIADRVAVMYLGRIVEIGPAAEVFGAPRHPYTELLLGSALRPDPGCGLPEVAVDGDLPDPTDPPSGCHFHPRCPRALEICRSAPPPTVPVGNSQVACHLHAGAVIQPNTARPDHGDRPRQPTAMMHDPSRGA